MQQLKTITVKTSNKVESVHMETLYAVIKNCYNSCLLYTSDAADE